MEEINCPHCGHLLKLPPNEVRRCRYCRKTVIRKARNQSRFPRSISRSIPPAHRPPLKSVGLPRFAISLGIGGIKGSEGSKDPSSWKGKIEEYHPQPKKRVVSLARILEPEIDEKNVIDDSSTYQLFGEFPYHTLDDIRCRITDGALEIESKLTEFLKKIPLPENLESSTPKVKIKNGILVITFKKRQG